MITSSNVIDAVQQLFNQLVESEHPKTRCPDGFYKEEWVTEIVDGVKKSRMMETPLYYVKDIYDERVYITAEDAAVIETENEAYHANEKNRSEARAVVKGHILSYLLTGRDGYPGPSGPMGMPGRDGKDCK